MWPLVALLKLHSTQLVSWPPVSTLIRASPIMNWMLVLPAINHLLLSLTLVQLQLPEMRLWQASTQSPMELSSASISLRLSTHVSHFSKRHYINFALSINFWHSGFVIWVKLCVEIRNQAFMRCRPKTTCCCWRKWYWSVSLIFRHSRRRLQSLWWCCHQCWGCPKVNR